MGLVMAVLTAGALVTTTGSAASADQPAPVLDWSQRSVSTIAHLPAGVVAGASANGVNYVASLTAVYTMSPFGVVQLLAGKPVGDIYGPCNDGQSGSAVRFSHLSALAVVGTHVFAADICGLREIDVSTGATVTVTPTNVGVSELSAGEDGRLYMLNAERALDVYNPVSKVQSRMLAFGSNCRCHLQSLLQEGPWISLDVWESDSYSEPDHAKYSYWYNTITGQAHTQGVQWAGYLASSSYGTFLRGQLYFIPPSDYQIWNGGFAPVAGSSPGNHDGFGSEARFTGLRALWTDGSVLYTGDTSGRITVLSPIGVTLPVSLGVSDQGVQLYPPTGISVASLADNGAKLLDFLLDGVSHPPAADGSLPPLPDGEHLVSIRVTNPDGSISVARTLHVVIDATAPLVSLALGLTVKVKGILALLSSGCVNISAVDPLGALNLASGLASLRIGVDLPVDVRPTGLPTPICALRPGVHALKWEAEDNAGNGTAGSMDVRWLPPLALTLTSPAANTITAGGQTLSYAQAVAVLGAATPQPVNGARIVAGTVSVNGAIQNLVDGLDYAVQVLVDGRPVGAATVTGGAWTFALPTGGLTAGPHTLTATLSDGVSDTAQTTPVTLTVLALPGMTAVPARAFPPAKAAGPVKSVVQRRTALR